MQNDNGGRIFFHDKNFFQIYKKKNLKVLVVLNPYAGRGRSLKLKNWLERLLKDAGIGAGWFVSEHTRHVFETLPRMDLSPYDAVISVGGDGTLFEVVNGLMGNKTRLPVSVIPSGTGNSFVKDLTPSGFTMRDHIKLLKNGNSVKVDLGKVTTPSGSYYFVNMVGFGFTTDVTLSGMKMRFLGDLAYTAAVLKELYRLRTYRLKMHLNGKMEEMNNVFVAVCNSRYAGGKFLMAPDAAISDGLFEILMVNDAGRLDLIRAFPAIFKGTHLSHPKVRYLKASEVYFETKNEPKQLAPDGEISGKLPVKIEVVPRAMEFFSNRAGLNPWKD
jgi:YegS/Rv2252/BmrU family lipid kinase